MMTDLIVFGSVALSAAFAVAWWLRPDLRAWIERPKYEFQDAVQDYDRGAAAMPALKGDHPRD